jgi:hypothetical protein
MPLVVCHVTAGQWNAAASASADITKKRQKQIYRPNVRSLDEMPIHSVHAPRCPSGVDQTCLLPVPPVYRWISQRPSA